MVTVYALSRLHMHFGGIAQLVNTEQDTFTKLKTLFMIADKIFYADAHEHIIVTDSTFIVKDKEYNIPSIRDHIIREVKPVPFIGVVMTIGGALIALSGMFRIITFSFIPPVTVMSRTIDSYWWAILIGTLLLFTGMLLILIVKPKYALHISTAEGAEDDVIISPKREYIRQIIDALNRAFMLRTK
jgi:hypothetical protein